jgi:hypothetical protein
MQPQAYVLNLVKNCSIGFKSLFLLDEVKNEVFTDAFCGCRCGKFV